MAVSTSYLHLTLARALGLAPATHEELVRDFGPAGVWDADELARDFDLEAVAEPFVLLRRKADGARGLAIFQGVPRLYYDFHSV
jgi:hypothetical protein